MELSTEVTNVLDKYFTSLLNSGYKSYEDVNKIIIYTLIEELLCGPMSEFVTKDDYKSIMSLLYCLYDSCNIPMPLNKSYNNEKVIVLSKCI